MREDYRDYHKTNHGNGIVEIFDHGQTFWEHNGTPVVECDECREMKLETELDEHDGVCSKCFEYAHTCQDCDEYFPGITLETVDGYPFCDSCLDEQERLAQIKPPARIDMVAMVKRMFDFDEERLVAK